MDFGRSRFSEDCYLTVERLTFSRIGLRNLCILVPVMGITWILGVFAVDENTVVFQYLFTIFNSLQVHFNQNII